MYIFIDIVSSEVLLNLDLFLDISDDCVLTRMSLLLTRFFFKMWVFGAAYYWGTWAFLFVSFIPIWIMAVCKELFTIGIKDCFSCFNVYQVSGLMLKTRVEDRGSQETWQTLMH